MHAKWFSLALPSNGFGFIQGQKSHRAEYNTQHPENRPQDAGKNRKVTGDQNERNEPDVRDAHSDQVDPVSQPAVVLVEPYGNPHAHKRKE